MARKVMTQLGKTMRTNRPQRYRHVVKVRPITDVAKQFVRHPIVGGFTGGDAGTTWPKDSFTIRRLRDRDIEIVPEAPAEEGQSRRQSPQRMTGHQRREASGGDV
jgi:hypothetical protein